MNRSIKRLLAASVTLVALSLGAEASALAGPATDTIKAKQTALFDLIKQATPESDKKVQAILNGLMDDPAIAEASLGSEWAARTDAEKAQFSDLLKQLVRKAYSRNLKKIQNFDVEYLTEEPSGGGVTVKTRAKSKTDARDEPVEIDFALAEKDGTWKVQDIVTEGVSLVGSYRSQFLKIIKKDGFAALIQKMKDKLAKGE